MKNMDNPKTFATFEEALEHAIKEARQGRDITEQAAMALETQLTSIIGNFDEVGFRKRVVQVVMEEICPSSQGLRSAT